MASVHRKLFHEVEKRLHLGHFNFYMIPLPGTEDFYHATRHASWS